MTSKSPPVRISFTNVAISILLVLLFSSIRKKLLWWMLFSTSLGGYLLYLGLTVKPAKVRQFHSTKRFVFLEQLRWNEELAKLSVKRSLLEKPAITESFLISESLDELFTLIIQEFVDSWYLKISTNRLFQDSIQLELKGVVSKLKERLGIVNLANLLVFKILPIINDHYTRFVSTANAQDSTYSIESKLATAQNFGRGKIHEGVSLSLPGTNQRKKEKIYLRRKVGTILPYLLSPQENTNEMVLLLLRELLSCTVLANVLEVLSEGDFFNQMIVKLIGANLKHRDQVKRLRAALQEHTAQNSNRDLAPSLSGTLTPSKVSKCVKFIENCDSVDELESLLRAVQEKQVSLATGSGDFEYEKTQLAVLTDRVSQKLQSSIVSGVSLEMILSQGKLAAVFREYLRKEKHETDIDLWQAIDRIKAPLETSNAGQVPLLLEFSSKDDILRIYSSFFNDPNIPISDEIREQVSSYVKCSDAYEAKAALYQRARQALFLLQENIAEHMKNHHFLGFQRSNRYGDLELGRENFKLRGEASLAFGGSNIQKLPPDTETETDLISPGVVKAVETAFEKIMKSSRDELDSNSLFNINQQSEIKTAPEVYEKADLFGDTLNFLNDDDKLDGFNLNTNRMSALFDDRSDSDTDSESINSESLLLSTDLTESQLANLEIILAAPGDLSLAEQIATLNNDIENLTEQDAILASLLRKAELTNNLPELRVLRKSKVSLEREINSKELQKQQYIVQENENSLYGKSKVQIQSCVFGNDDSTSYVLYIIEVQKFSSDDPTVVLAGWVVARRFSQFYKLNEYLKRRCPEVMNIKFPKKSVPMLKFQKIQQVEMRKPMLEKYLQSLLKIPEVCSDPAFRSFLSSEDFLLGNVQGVKASPKKFDAFFNRFYGKVSQAVPVASTIRPRNEDEQKEILANIQEMERELKQFDEIGKDGAKIPFVKPISDLLMTIFNLRNSKSWLRGRALLVILQQVLGSAIEKTITQQVEANLRQEEKLLGILDLLKEMLFPNKKFRESPEMRTKSEQTSTRQEANVILRIFMNETCAKVFGLKNTNQASTHLFEMFQNDFLNKQLLFEVLDELISAICPEAEDTN